MSGTCTAIDSRTNKIAGQHKTPYRIGGGGGSSVTAGGLVFRGEPDGNFLAPDAKTGKELWRVPTPPPAPPPPPFFPGGGGAVRPGPPRREPPAGPAPPPPPGGV